MNLLADLGARALRMLPAEMAHTLAVRALALGLGPRDTSAHDPVLASKVMGLEFTNPLGVAAGFDKDARAPDALIKLGFGFAEVGTVTPLAQPGNPKPRMFRLVDDKAVINRLGFNNQGLDAFCQRLDARRAHVRVSTAGIVGANIGANKDSANRIADYVTGVERVGPLVSYVTVNISSPNTPGLRDLQAHDALQELTQRVAEARDGVVGRTGHKLPLVLKIAPDLAPEDIVDAVEIACKNSFDGMIVSNTTIARTTSLKSPHKDETGGLSGAPLLHPSTDALRLAAYANKGRLALIGAGGVASGADAYMKIRAGASLVQLYTAFGYEGPSLIPRIRHELADLLRRDGFATVSDAVGTDVKIPEKTPS
ncbi:quinone-dependent dihydroorotate dehydrogenase [Pyruvatibacter sp.]|uniref:quinone-dependent dihydroorotate dehydrogenase n=1 Tax=Pyruvatibacter sp. TaxID=1981328 RepID=UPI0032ECB224